MTHTLFENFVFIIAFVISSIGVIKGKEIGGKKGIIFTVTVYTVTMVIARMLGVE